MEILERLKYILGERRSVTVLEFGACDGYHTNLMLSVIKEVDRYFLFHGFEPNADLHPRILNNIKGHLMFSDGIIGIFPHAVGAEVGETTFYKSGGVKVKGGKEVDWYYGSSSIRKPTKLINEDYPDMTFTEGKTFVTTLDHHYREHLFRNKIDFIWADIQGAEIDLIKGGLQTLENHTRYLYTEYLNSPHYEGQIGLQGILNLLPGFEILEDYGEDVLLRNKNLYFLD